MTAVVTLAMTGCTAGRVNNPLTHEFGSNKIDAQFEFWHQLATRPLTSNDEALHGLLLYALDADPANTYEERVAEMTARGWLPRGFKREATEAVRRGDVAVAAVRILGIKGGLMLRLTGGKSPRYALLELEDLGILPTSSENQSFSGSEFFGVVGRMEDYRRGNDIALPAAETVQALE
jgi:hypothetical protein